MYPSGPFLLFLDVLYFSLFAVSDFLLMGSVLVDSVLLFIN